MSMSEGDVRRLLASLPIRMTNIFLLNGYRLLLLHIPLVRPQSPRCDRPGILVPPDTPVPGLLRGALLRARPF